ncbi:putative succinate semialdehyde dehydrogenase, mitochondrial [Operophtera brumata]|uniref:Succinate-semialdehyde dehydrogenase, mitochondrial n=1 Tax=Operophtera brumata TaxID=104452 RepID=A0A0L7LV53_OPEBR|nr:putative succinate semialdehyde dehydrogenase, mitochondrial [Operophtera brumata]
MDLLRAGTSRQFKLYLTQYRNMHLLKNQAYVNGEWVKAGSNAVFPVLNPADDSAITEVPDMDANDAKNAVKVASDTFKTWRETTAKDRSYILRKWYDMCVQNTDHLAEIITAESGKPLAEAKGEVAYGNSFLEWFADTARQVNGEVIPSPWPNKQVLLTRQPLGVVSVITPWNFPFAMITRKVGALMAVGCTCVIKPSEDTPLSALAAVALAEQAGVPKGVINVVTSSRKNAPAVGKVLCEDDSVGCISFTGSTAVGKILYGMAAKGIKRVSLELGGNAPFIVFPSADIEHALDQAMFAKFRNNGQACIGANRFLIHEDVYDKFVTGFKSRIGKKCILGPGNKEGVTCGPLVNLEQAKKVSGLVSDAMSKGAKALIGGKFNTGLGNKFYESTLLVDVKPDMKIYSEEIFGPVATCLKFKTEDEVLKIANSTRSGLASYVFTKELGQAFRMSKNLEFGMVAINDGILSAPEPAFGGIKESGIGREGSKHGAEEYTDIKYTLMSGLDKVQEVDNGFFEKFGSILKQASQRAALEESTPLAPLKEVEEQDNEQKVETDLQTENSSIRDSDSGNGTLLDTDSEPDEHEKIDRYIEALGWNGREERAPGTADQHADTVHDRCEVGQLAMLSYVQEAFKISNDKHNELMTKAEAKEPPELMLNVEVVEAKDLVPKDPNGMSDPFVTIYMMSNSSQRPMPGNFHEDSLCLEVWDFDPAETVKEKMTKIFDVKGSIPAGGMTMWFSLSKKSKLRRQGVVKVRLNFSSEKNSQVAPFWWCGNFSAQAEAIITQHAAQSGLSQQDNTLVQWCVYCAVTIDHPLSFALFNTLLDKISKPVKSGLINEEDVKLFWGAAKKLLPTCFSRIRKLRKKTEDEKSVMKMLREVLKILHKLSILDVPETIDLFPESLYGWLRESKEDKRLTIHDVLQQAVIQGASDWFVHILDNNECKDKSEETTLQHLIKVVQLIASLVEPEVLEVCKSLKRLRYSEGSTNSVHLAGGLSGETGIGTPTVENEPLAMGTTLFELYLTLQRFLTVHLAGGLSGETGIGTPTVENEPLAMGTTLFELYLTLQRFLTVHLAGGLSGETGIGTPTVENEPLAMGTTLFELYLTLQRFLTLGQALNETEWSSYAISHFHTWFFGGVAQWLDIAAYKALSRIEKAVDLDNLAQVDTNVKYSSSGMAGRVESVGAVSTVFEERFEVTTAWCVAINNIDYVRQSLEPFVAELGMEDIVQRLSEARGTNNIDYVRQSLEPFVAELGMEDIVQRLSEARSPFEAQSLEPFVAELGMEDIVERLSETRSAFEAQRCKETMQNVIANAIDTVKNKIVDLLLVMMMPSITRFLVEGAELLHQDCSSMDRVMRYLEANLDTLHEHLNNENFSRTLDIVWEQLGDVLYELIQANLEKEKLATRISLFRRRYFGKNKVSPIYIYRCLKIMIRSFRQDNGKEAYSSETLRRVEYLLKIHGMETRELIHQYHLERWQEQQAIQEPKMGLLTVRAQFIDDHLKVEVMNARNLTPTDSNGFCDSYVRVGLLPEDTFASVVKPKTQTHSKNLFPLYDEMFMIPLNHEQRTTAEGLLHFVIKDKDMFSMSNTFVGEAYLHFNEVPDTPAPISSLPQQLLTLTRPASIDYL